MVKQQKRPYKHLEIQKTQGKCIEDAEESCGPLGYAKDARILMTIAKAGGIGRKWTEFDIKSRTFQKDNTIRSPIVTCLTTIDFIAYKRPRHAPYSRDLAPVDLSRLKS